MQRWPATLGFALLCAVTIYWSYEGVGFDPSFPLDGNLADFGSFYEMGRAASRGESLYAVYPLTYFQVPNVNLPIVGVLMLPLAQLDAGLAARIWSIGGVVAYLVAVGLLFRAYPERRSPARLLWAFAVSSLWGTFALGQVYAYLALVATGAWLLLGRGRLILAALFLGLLIALKPNLVVWPVLLALIGLPLVLLVSAAVAVALSTLPALLFGPRVYAEWLSAVTTIPQPVGQASNGSLFAVTERLGLPGWAGVAAAAGLLLGLAVWTWRCRPGLERTSAAGIVGALLAFPLSWTGYSLLLLPVFVSRRWRIALLCAAALLLVPVRFVFAGSESLLIASTYTIIWLLVLIDVLEVSARLDGAK